LGQNLNIAPIIHFVRKYQIFLTKLSRKKIVDSLCANCNFQEKPPYPFCS
jgi:hypothetical protein